MLVAKIDKEDPDVTITMQFRWYARDRGGLTAEQALEMALGTLGGMARGGIRDHIGKEEIITCMFKV